MIKTMFQEAKSNGVEKFGVEQPGFQPKDILVVLI